MQDLWFALRLLRTRPGFTLAAVIPLAAAIACATAVLTLVDAVLYRPLGVKNPASLVAIYGYSRSKAAYLSDSWPEFRDVSALSGVVDSATAYVRITVNADLGGGSERLAAELVSGGYFGTVGVAPVLGRALGPEDDRPDAAPALLVSYRLWSEQPLPAKPRGARRHHADRRCRLLDCRGDARGLHRHPAGLGRGSAVVDSNGLPGAAGAGLRDSNGLPGAAGAGLRVDRLPEPRRRALGDDDREAQARDGGPVGTGRLGCARGAAADIQSRGVSGSPAGGTAFGAGAIFPGLSRCRRALPVPAGRSLGGRIADRLLQPGEPAGGPRGSARKRDHHPAGLGSQPRPDLPAVSDREPGPHRLRRDAGIAACHPGD
ncbi:exported hypothetical protein [Candidatus Sulfopaludibacter sp. SbA4]|nr:exported hypothetical protein [Candidatus Sulfopaludibacter sp. SbA4]